jgi:hypothetical protein
MTETTGSYILFVCFEYLNQGINRSAGRQVYLLARLGAKPAAFMQYIRGKDETIMKSNRQGLP